MPARRPKPSNADDRKHGRATASWGRPADLAAIEFDQPLITGQQQSANTFRLPTAKTLAKEAGIAIPLVFVCLFLISAASAGLLYGDTITRVDDHPIENFNSLFDTLRDNYASGDTVMIAVTRGDKTVQIEVTLASRPSLPKRD